jgi:hypothetical protein
MHRCGGVDTCHWRCSIFRHPDVLQRSSGAVCMRTGMGVIGLGWCDGIEGDKHGAINDVSIKIRVPTIS